MVTTHAAPAPLLDIYTVALRARRCDERFLTMLTAGEIAMTYYSPRGQEVISAAVCALLSDEDYLVTTYRGLHDHIAKGVPLGALWAEFLGRATGTCKGKGGPMHITAPEHGLMVTTGLVGAGLPIANGLALSSSLRGDNRVTVCTFGDGATNIGAFHEALNLASLWSLPIVFVCQNNLYGEKTAFARHTKAPDVASRAASYSMPSVQVDGNDAQAVWLAAAEALERARSGGGPTLMEAVAFRFRGHHFGDDSGYIPRDLFEQKLREDGLPRLRETLLAKQLASPEDLDQIDSMIGAEIDDAVTYALESPYPHDDQLLTDVFAAGGLR